MTNAERAAALVNGWASAWGDYVIEGDEPELQRLAEMVEAELATVTVQRDALLAACETYKAAEDYQAEIPIWEFTAEQRDELRRRRYETYSVIMAAIAATKGTDE